MKKIFSDLGKELGLIILYIVLNIGLQLLLHKDILSNNLFLSNLAYIFIELLILTIFIIIFRKIIIPDYYDFKNNYKKYIKENFKYYISGLLIMLFTNILISSFIGLPANEESVRGLLIDLPVYYFIAAVIAGPILEELLTRQILKDTFKNKIIYYFTSGIIFASLHLLSATKWQEVFYIIPYGALGFMFAIMYNKTNNIWTSIFFHFLHNFVATLLILIPLFLGWL